MDLILVSDAWHPQVNGVVRTFDKVVNGLKARGWDVTIIGPDRFRTIPCPTYPDIPLAIAPGRRVARLIDAALPAKIHIATEGPLGMAARAHCIRRRLPFTTAYCTRFPEYLHLRTRLPLDWTYGVMRWFHARSHGVMVAAPSVVEELTRRGFRNIRRWTRGVDTELFRPRDKGAIADKRPIALYAGRVAVEKNIEAFLEAPFEGTKYVVGAGPQLPDLVKKYPHVKFTGSRTNGAFAALMASADVFVFPSLTDTFGLVMLEAMASGIPVAAFPVSGPTDVIGTSGAGALDSDLGRAIQRALSISPETARAHALTYSWDRCIDQFVGNLAA
jgi:glycosyltransferase involved in cell wall biosynthesis